MAHGKTISLGKNVMNTNLFFMNTFMLLGEKYKSANKRYIYLSSLNNNKQTLLSEEMRLFLCLLAIASYLIDKYINLIKIEMQSLAGGKHKQIIY